MIARFVDEWQTIPWTPRARRLGHALVGVFFVTTIVFGPALAEGFVNWLVP